MPRAPSDFEQLMMELVNRSRADPLGELDRLIISQSPVQGVEPSITNALNFFDVDMAVLYNQLQGVPAVAPLAWNLNLGDSAQTHSELMIAFDTQSHNLPGEVSLRQRFNDADYTGWSLIGENIFAFTQSPLYGHAGFYIDWGFSPTGIQTPAGHRDAILNGTYTEIGISAIPENNGATNVGPYVVTQHLGNRFGDDAKLTGVVIDDVDNDDFYDIGEGLGGVGIVASGAAGTFSVSTFDSGGYTLEVPDGTYTITFSGAALGGFVSKTVAVSGSNIKIDAEVDDLSDTGSALENQVFNNGLISRDILLGGGDDLYDGRNGQVIGTIDGGSGDDALLGGAANDTLQDLAGGNWIVGGGGGDTVIVDIDNSFDSIFAGEVNGTDTSTNDTISLASAATANIFLGLNFIQSHAPGTPLSAWIAGFENAEGSLGDDAIIGDANNNRIDGDDGSDWLVGARGADTFVFRHWLHVDNDQVRDFSDLDQDVIDLSQIDADWAMAGNQAFSLMANHTNNTAAEIVVTDFGASALVEFYVDANNTVDAALVVAYEDTASTTLGAGDFIL